jgi:hypothetical protein
MKPSESLLNKVMKDDVLRKGVDNPKLDKALSEISKDPKG